MKRVAVEITGKTPIILNRFTDEAASNESRSSIQDESKTPIEQCEKALYRSGGDADGVLGIPGPNLFRCIIDAGTYFKVGKSKVTTMKTSMIPAFVAIEEIFLPFQDGAEWKVDSRPIRNPSTGGRMIRHRPCFDEWALSFTLETDEEYISLRLLRDIVDAAGKRIGLGDFRPACKGPYGRFLVTKWIEEK